MYDTAAFLLKDRDAAVLGFREKISHKNQRNQRQKFIL